MKRFSDRVRATEPRRELQIGSMDQSLRNALWNWILWMLTPRGSSSREDYWWRLARLSLWDEFFHLPVDEIPRDVQREVKNRYGRFEWWEVYNLVEFVLNVANEIRGQYDKRDAAEAALNSYLERELAGYRAIGGQIVPITSEAEVAEVRTAATPERGFEGVAEHVDTALTLLGKKPEPDYRNSIKESISAVEAAVKLLTDKRSGGIDTALAVLDKRSQLHPAFRTALSKLYGYTSDEEGIRHPILEEANVTFAEAKFMLVACSAFANLLIGGGR